MSVLPRICYPLSEDAEYRAGPRKWSVICKVKDASGKMVIKSPPVNVIALSEAAANQKAIANLKAQGFSSVEVYSTMEI